MLYRIKHQQPKEVQEKTDPKSHTNYRFLSLQEKTTRLRNLHDQVRILHQTIYHLRDQVEKLIDENAIVVEDDLDEA